MLAIANSSGRAGFKVALNDGMKGLAPLNATQRCQSLINYERSAREWLESAAHIPFTRLDNSLPCPLLISDAGDGTAAGQRAPASSEALRFGDLIPVHISRQNVAFQARLLVALRSR